MGTGEQHGGPYDPFGPDLGLSGEKEPCRPNAQMRAQGDRGPLLRLQFAAASEKLEERERVDQRNAITSPLLIPFSEPEQTHNLFWCEAALRQSFCFHEILVSIHLTVE